MQPSGDRQSGNPYRQAPSDARSAAVVDPGRKRSRSRWTGCLVWGMVCILGLGLAALFVIGAGYAGWSSGVELARENGTSTAAADVQLQCQRLAADIESGNHQLLEARIEYLRAQTPEPGCLNALLPTATALFRADAPTATAHSVPTVTTVATDAPLPTIAATVPLTAESTFEYDLDALLDEAQIDTGRQNYRRAIDTLDAIIAIDGEFQSERVNSMYFEALTAQAQTLYRTGKLSEAIVVTGRAEAHGDIGQLNYERSIARSYLDGQRLKVINPGESVRLFSNIVYTFGHGDYMNGQILAELQEAHYNYGDAFAFQGDLCLAHNQYEAALALSPIASNVVRDSIRAKRDQAAEACPSAAVNQSPLQTSVVASSSAESTRVPQAAIGVRPSPAPVGQSG